MVCTNVEIQIISSIFADNKAKDLSKIILVGPAYPLRGGLATYNERLAREFIKEGDEVVIYTFSLQYPSFLFPGKTQFSESPPPEDLKIRVRVNSVNPFNWLGIGKEISKEKPDLVLVRYWIPFMAPCLGTILRMVRKTGAKRVAIADNIVPHEKRPGDRMLTKYFLKNVDFVVSMSESVLGDLRDFSQIPAQVVKHPLYDNFGDKMPVAQARASLGIPDTAYAYLFFGFIRKYKGLEILLEAFEKLAAIDENAYLVIAGEYYSLEKELSEKIGESNYQDRIIEHTRFISDEEVSKYFSAADVVVQPYHHATQSGVTPLAYHFEVPMIVTNVGALPDMVPSGLGLISEVSSEAILNAMIDIKQLDKQTFSQKIKIEKAKYSWGNMTRALKSVLS